MLVKVHLNILLHPLDIFPFAFAGIKVNISVLYRLVIASHLDPIQVLEKLCPFLKSSAPIIIYSQYRESLYQVYSYIRSCTEYVDF